MVRGSTVVAVMGTLLLVTRFFHAEELRWLNGLMRQRVGGKPVVMTAETTEKAGEIVSVDVPDELIRGPKGPHR
jgi:hypothetical protein